MSDATPAAVGGAIGRLPSAKENFAATAAVRELAQGPWTVPGGGPHPWSVSDLQLDQNEWSSLCVSRGVGAVPALLWRLRRQVLQRRYTQHRRGGNSSFPLVPAVPSPAIDVESYFKALDAAKPSDGPFVVEGYGEWSLAELQLDKRQWSRLLSDRGVVSTPKDLKKLRRKMKGRQYSAKSSAGRKSSPPPLCSPQPDELWIDGLFDLAPTELFDLGLDDASVSTAPTELFDLGLDDASVSTAPTELFDLGLDDASVSTARCSRPQPSADGPRIAALAADLAALAAEGSLPPPSCSPQPDELWTDGLFDHAPTELFDLAHAPDLTTMPNGRN